MLQALLSSFVLKPAIFEQFYDLYLSTLNLDSRAYAYSPDGRYSSSACEQLLQKSILLSRRQHIGTGHYRPAVICRTPFYQGGERPYADLLSADAVVFLPEKKIVFGVKLVIINSECRNDNAQSNLA